MSFMRESAVASTRKEHRCSGCNQSIAVGSEAIRWAGMVDGDLQSVIYHTDCREAEVAFNDMHGLGGCDWCCLAYDRETEDDEWLASAFPKVAERLGVMVQQ